MKLNTKRHSQTAFTLMEVMIATAIFFAAMFTILELMKRGLSMARSLQRDVPTPAMIASGISQMASTNKLEDGGTLSGDFEDIVPKLYKDYKWAAHTYQVASNGLFQADILVTGMRQERAVELKMSILLFSPNSAVSGFGGGGFQ